MSAEARAAAGRARERHRRAALTSAALLGARASGFVTTLVSIPLVLHSAGPERSGVWLTLVSFVALLGFADLGVGNGLLNAAAGATGRGDVEALVGLVSTSFYLLVGVGLIFGAVVAAAYRLVPWADLVNAGSPAVRSEVGPSVAGMLALLLVNLPLGVAGRVQLALQEGFRPNLWQILGNGFGLAGLVIAVGVHAELRWLVWAAVAGPVLGAAGNSAVFYGSRRRDLLPRPVRVARVAMRSLGRLGASFLVLQVAVAVAYQSDSLVIANVLGPTAVQQYAAPVRLFMVPMLLAGIIVGPLWPAYAEAISRQDIGWVVTTLRRTLLGALGGGLATAAVMLLSARPLLQLWVGNAVAPSSALLVALGAWLVVMTFSAAVTTFLNGAGILARQAAWAAVMMVANLGLSILLAREIGISGVVWGTVLAQLLFFLGPALLHISRRLRGTAAFRSPALPHGSAVSGSSGRRSGRARRAALERPGGRKLAEQREVT